LAVSVTLAARPLETLLRGSIQDEVGDGNFGGAELSGAAQQRTKTREQLAEFERLGEVIVSTVIETGDAVFHGHRAAGQHKNGHALAGLAQARGKLQIRCGPESSHRG